MKCSEASWAMSQLHDGVMLESQVESELKAHLKVCPPCRGFQETVGQISHRLETQSKTLSDSVKDRISQQLAQRDSET